MSYWQPPAGQTSAPFSAQTITGIHGRGEAESCAACQAMRDAADADRYPGAWPGDLEPFGHEPGPQPADQFQELDL
jgi:hypothetical protein